VSVDNLDEMEPMSTDDEDDDEDEVTEDGEAVGTAAGEVNQPVNGKHCCLRIICQLP